MNKVLVFCIIALAVLITIPAYAEVQNVKVSGDLSARWILKYHSTLSKDPASTSGSGYDFLQSAAEAQIDADLTDNVSTVVRLANQRKWGDPAGLSANLTSTPNSKDSSFDVIVDLANVTLKELVYSPLTVTIGRQDLWFGKGFVIGAKQRDPNNAITAKEYTVINSFDAIKATLDFDPWKIDGVFSVIEENTTNKMDDAWMLGANVGYKFDSYKGEAEAYYWRKQDDSKSAIVGGTSTARCEDNSINLLGVRGSMEPIANAAIAAELAWQGGRYSTYTMETRKRDAWATDISGDYNFKDVKWAPTIGLEYIYYSGESKTSVGDAQGSNWKGWDTFYRGKFDSTIREFQNLYYLTTMRSQNATVQSNPQDAGSSNENQFILKGGLKPTNSLKVDGRFAWFRMNKSQADTTGAQRSRDLGTELDLTLSYDYTEDVSFGLLAGWFFPGKYWLSGQNETATDVVGTVKVAF